MIDLFDSLFNLIPVEVRVYGAILFGMAFGGFLFRALDKSARNNPFR